MATHDAARRALVEFLSAVAIPARVRTVSTTGWYRPTLGGAVPQRTVGVVPGEVVRLDADPPPRIYRQGGTLAGWQTEVAARCIGNSRLTFAVSCGFAGPLLPLAEDEGGGINFRGGSSTGKTTIGDTAASVWGAPSKTGAHSFTRSWNQTENAIEETAAVHNHALLPIDELGQADPAKLPEMLYMLSHGVGRTRMRASGGNRPTVTWLALLLSSGEESAARLVEQVRRRFKAGQEIRMLDVPAEVPSRSAASTCFEVLHDAADGTAGPAFVETLADTLARRPDFVAETLLSRVQQWASQQVPPGADGQVRRAARRFAMVAIAGELASEAGITGWPAGVLAAAVAIVFRDWLAERGGIGSREDHHRIAALRRFIGMHGAARFAQVREPGEEDEGAQVEPPLNYADRTIVRAGWRWQETSGAAERCWVHGILGEVFDAEIAAPLGMESRDARACLGKAGMIRGINESGEKRWAGKFKRIPGHDRPRLIVAEPKVLEGE